MPCRPGVLFKMRIQPGLNMCAHVFPGAVLSVVLHACEVMFVVVLAVWRVVVCMAEAPAGAAPALRSFA